MEMMNTSDDPCTFSGDMLAYLYDELSPDGRVHFESHLSGCSRCIDEFAELSMSRYSVYEWKKLEFAPLATPRFIVPVRPSSEKVSWRESICAAFAWNVTAATAGGMAVLLLGLFGFATYFGDAGTRVTLHADTGPLSGQTTPAGVAAPLNESTGVEDPEIAASESISATAPRSQPAPAAAPLKPDSPKARLVRRSSVKTEPIRRTPTNRRLENSPTLGQYVEDRDESLRLSDLFNDLDSRQLD